MRRTLLTSLLLCCLSVNAFAGADKEPIPFYEFGTPVRRVLTHCERLFTAILPKTKGGVVAGIILSAAMAGGAWAFAMYWIQSSERRLLLKGIKRGTYEGNLAPSWVALNLLEDDEHKEQFTDAIRNGLFDNNTEAASILLHRLTNRVASRFEEGTEEEVRDAHLIQTIRALKPYDNFSGTTFTKLKNILLSIEPKSNRSKDIHPLHSELYQAVADMATNMSEARQLGEYTQDLIIFNDYVPAELKSRGFPFPNEKPNLQLAFFHGLYLVSDADDMTLEGTPFAKRVYHKDPGLYRLLYELLTRDDGFPSTTPSPDSLEKGESK